MAPELRFLQGYDEELQSQALGLLRSGRLSQHLAKRYPDPPEVTSDRALYDYVMALKTRYLKTASPLSRISFDERLSTLENALGQHRFVSRVQGGRLKAKNEVRIASLFKETPPEFLRMVVVHELAHLREKEHDKAFYQLCCHMEPNYHQYEFDLRLYLTKRCFEERTG